MIGILEHISGRKLIIDGQTVYLRKGVDSAQYWHLLQSDVEVVTVEEKGFLMTNNVKPALPKTEVEKTKPVEMLASANVPRLKFGDPTSFTTATEVPHKASQKPDNRTPKDKIITASWAMGNTLLSPALAQANDALALSTEQTLERAKTIATELIRWVEEQSVK